MGAVEAKCRPNRVEARCGQRFLILLFSDVSRKRMAPLVGLAVRSVVVSSRGDEAWSQGGCKSQVRDGTDGVHPVGECADDRSCNFSSTSTVSVRPRIWQIALLETIFCGHNGKVLLMIFSRRLPHSRGDSRPRSSHCAAEWLRLLGLVVGRV